MENNVGKILWGFTSKSIEPLTLGKPDLAVINTQRNECKIIDVVIPSDNNVQIKNFAVSIGTVWNENTNIISVVIEL